MKLSLNVSETIRNAEALGDRRPHQTPGNCTERLITEEIIRAPAYSALKSMQMINEVLGPRNTIYDTGARRAEYRSGVEWATRVLSSNMTVHQFHADVVDHGDPTACPNSADIAPVGSYCSIGGCDERRRFSVACGDV